MADFSLDKPVSTENSDVILDNTTVTKLFKKLKRSNIFNENLHLSFNKYVEPPIELLHTNDFMDKIKYYRLYKRIPQRQIAIYAGVDPETYRDFEIKKYEIQDFKIAEKFIEFLNIEKEVELPDYFKFMKKYPLDKLKKLIDEKFGRKKFSNLTEIKIPTINSWYQKDKVKNISTCTYKKIVDSFKNNDIDY